MKKIRVAAVSYLNTKPLLFGIKGHPISDEIELIEDYPSKIAQMLINDEVDLGLIPVAATLRLPYWEIQTDYCIGCTGPVASVCIFSQVPMENIEHVYLDYQSRTSVNLAKVLLENYWNKKVQFTDAQGEDFRDQIAGTTAGVVIGDRALEQRSRSSFIYDLGEAWIDFTQLPFVFAGWIANKKLDRGFIERFNEATGNGLAHLDAVVSENHFPAYSLDTYYKKNISYQLDSSKRQGMKLFLDYLKERQEQNR